MSGSKHVTLHALELNYDPKSPRFGAGTSEDAPGLYVEWATEDSGMVKGDRYCFQATDMKEDRVWVYSSGHSRSRH